MQNRASKLEKIFSDSDKKSVSTNLIHPVYCLTFIPIKLLYESDFTRNQCRFFSLNRKGPTCFDCVYLLTQTVCYRKRLAWTRYYI